MEKKTIPVIKDHEIISNEFVNKYKNKKVNWGFNGLGGIVYKRTYSRVKEDGLTEEWRETIQRCINGAQKIGAQYTKDEAERLFDLIFNLKCCFAGRMLWQLGTSTVDRFGGNSLLNCWAVKINEPAAFEFLFENLMLGGGVGYSIRREDVHEFPKIKKDVNIIHLNTKDADLIVADSRSGWIRLLHYVLKSFFQTGKSFSYSTILVRGAGEPIKGFGGVSSGPGILISGISKICDILKAREGKKLRSIDALDICNIIGSIVVSGNVRRSAQIALGDPDDYLFLRAKRWDLGILPSWRSMSNNTIYADDYSHIVEDFWQGYLGNGEPYGLFNLPLCQKNGRLGEEIEDNCFGVNPCTTGDTLVYVADGRVNVPIKQLAEENKDVPVFCYDKNNNLTIRYMRNPRITGHKQEIYKVTLDDGSVIRTTANHKFLLTSGLYKEVKDLSSGDSLKILTRYQASFEEIFKKSNSKSQNYIWINNGQRKSRTEHGLIAEFHYNSKIKSGFVVHHKDYNGQNNNPLNLEVLSKRDHDNLHRNDKIGDKNPMRRAKKEWSDMKWAAYRKKQSELNAYESNSNFSGYTNDDLKKHALILTKKLGRRFSIQEWREYAKEYKLPISFSKWRKDHLGSLSGLSKWAAVEMDLVFIHEDTRVVRTYKKAISEGYDAEILNKEVFVRKACEVTGAMFLTPYSRREVSVLGRREANIKTWQNAETREKRVNGVARFNAKRQETVRQNQIKIYLDLAFKLKNPPLRKEWERKCIENNVSREIGRESSPFKCYEDLKDASSFFNHKVVSVEKDGYEDVYNGTVDEFHNFFVGGFEGKTKSNKNKWLYINNLQCGEVPLSNYEACNLSEIFLNNISSREELIECSKLLYKTQKAVSALPFIHEQTNEIVHKNMRLGLGVTGICQSLSKLDWLDEAYKELRKFDKEWSKFRGWPSSIKLTVLKPSGSLSLLAGSTPGIHPAFSRFYIRRIRMSSNDKLVPLCKEAGFYVEYSKNIDKTENHDTVVVSFPCKSDDLAILSKDLSAVKQLELVKLLQTKWADNAVSVTVYYKKEELPEIKEWLKNHYKNSIKSVSFLLHSDHGFEQAPYEEINEDQYNKIAEKIKSIDFCLKSNEQGEMLSGIECAGGSCPIR